MFNKNTGLTFFILGAAAGSMVTLFFATREGKVFRRILKNDTNLLWENASEKGQEFFSAVESSVNHCYKRAIRLLNREFMGIRAGINAAVKTFSENEQPFNFAENITDDFISEDSSFGFSDEHLPKIEGMKKRVVRKRFK